MKQANPYLNFDGNTEEAFNFYRTVFGGEYLAVLRFRDFGDNQMGIPEGDLDKIAHIALPIAGDNLLMATDVLPSIGQTLKIGNNSYIQLEAESADEAEKVFSGLSADGTIEMPLESTQWAEKYGICTDRFGVQWMINYTGSVEFPGSGD